MKEKTFLKAILLSFLIHITGISLFSIFLPLPLKKRKPIEIIPYSFESKRRAEKIVLKEVKENIGTEKIKVFQDIVPVRISNRDIIGEKEYVSKVNFKIDIETTKFEISLPQIPLTEVYKEIKKEELIEGPAGSRKIIYKEKIEYPLWAQKKGIEGKVKIKFWVNPEGKIIDTEIFSSSGYPEIDLYAEENFKKWVFDTVKSDKNVWGIITIIFKLK